MSVVGRVALLVAIWVLAWGELSLVNVIVGAVLAAALLVAFPPNRGRGRFRSGVRPVGVVRLVAYLLGQLVTSNLLVAREILSRRSRVHTGVIAHQIHVSSDLVLTLIANAIALTPGTMTVEATRDPPVLHVHFLLLDDVEEAHRSLARLERLVIGAFGRGAPPYPPTSPPPRGSP